MNFEDIPKRVKRRKETKGVRNKISRITDDLGNSPFQTPIIAFITPIMLSVVTAMTLILYSLAMEGQPTDKLFLFAILTFIVLFVTAITFILTYSYIGYISYQQIKHNVHRWTGIVSIGLMIVSIFSLIYVVGIF